MSMYDPTSIASLKNIVRDHSALITDGFLWSLMEQIPPELSEGPEAQFLKAVRIYDEQHHAADKRWDLAYHAFEVLPKQPGTILEFFGWNYMALGLRNHAPDAPCLGEWFRNAVRAALALQTTPEMHLALGFVYLNQGRWFLTYHGEEGHALLSICNAMQHRIAWFRHLQEFHKHYDPIALAGAAEQVRKLHEGFQKWFPQLKPHSVMCTTDALIEEVTAIAPGDRSVK